MQHAALDRYIGGSSCVHRLDPRLKLAGTVAYIVALTTLPEGAWLALGVGALIGFGLVGLAQMPLTTALRRTSVALPFVGVVAISLPFTQQGTVIWAIDVFGAELAVTDYGLGLFATLLSKGWLSVLVSSVLVATTPFPLLVQAMRRLHVPEILTTIIAFMYRYLFVLVDEAMRMQTARAARSAGHGRTLFWRAQVLGRMIGSLFIRSYERSERIYAAMLSRGYAGRLLTLNRLAWERRDTLASAIWAATLVALVAAGHVIG